jgi:hypothetical protein
MPCEFKILQAHFNIYFKNGLHMTIFLNVSLKIRYVEFVFTPQNFAILRY